MRLLITSRKEKSLASGLGFMEVDDEGFIIWMGMRMLKYVLLMRSRENLLLHVCMCVSCTRVYIVLPGSKSPDFPSSVFLLSDLHVIKFPGYVGKCIDTALV